MIWSSQTRMFYETYDDYGIIEANLNPMMHMHIPISKSRRLTWMPLCFISWNDYEILHDISHDIKPWDGYKVRMVVRFGLMSENKMSDPPLSKSVVPPFDRKIREDDNTRLHLKMGLQDYFPQHLSPRISSLGFLMFPTLQAKPNKHLRVASSSFRSVQVIYGDHTW